MDTILLILMIAAIVLLLTVVMLLLSGRKKQDTLQLEQQMKQLQTDMTEAQRATREEMAGTTRGTVRELGEMLAGSQKAAAEVQTQRIADLDRNLGEKQTAMNQTVTTMVEQLDKRFASFEQSNEQKLEAMRQTMEQRLARIQNDNNEKLEEMRRTVDEKLQKTLEDKMTKSFQMVSERLEQVYKGLGEMQTLAVGVGDLKKVLSNVKNRGILGEIQLGAILEDILAPEQYDTNVPTIPGSRNPVEYAVKLPGGDGGHVYLPIDSKFPADAYQALQNAYDIGSQEAVTAARNVLKTRLKAFAKDIRDKYVEPPYTTEFGILFLPFEGLYAEVVNHGLVEELQREYHINIAGPSTMAALLNSLQMGFRTLAIEKKSSEVWQILGAVKSEFGKFSDVLQKTQERLNQANHELETLVGTRTRAIQRKLKAVETLDTGETAQLLELNDTEEG